PGREDPPRGGPARPRRRPRAHGRPGVPRGARRTPRLTARAEGATPPRSWPRSPLPDRAARPPGGTSTRAVPRFYARRRSTGRQPGGRTGLRGRVTMAVHMSLAGNSAGDGFLIAPLGSTYPAELLLWTDAGTASVTLQASPDAAGLVFSQTSLTLSTAPSSVMVHSTLQSGAREDTTIQVLDGATVVASFTVTSINDPVVHFRGRFEARFATDNAPYNRNPMYTATNDAAVPPGW